VGSAAMKGSSLHVFVTSKSSVVFGVRVVFLKFSESERVYFFFFFFFCVFTLYVRVGDRLRRRRGRFEESR